MAAEGSEGRAVLTLDASQALAAVGKMEKAWQGLEQAAARLEAGERKHASAQRASEKAAEDAARAAKKAATEQERALARTAREAERAAAVRERAESRAYAAQQRGIDRAARNLRAARAEQQRLAQEAADAEVAAIEKVERERKKAEADAARASKKASADQKQYYKEAAAGALAGFAAVGAAAAGAQRIMDQGAEAILRIDDASRRLTVGRDTLLALARAGEQTGVAFSEIEGAIENLPERIVQAAEGGNEYADAFEALGVSVTDTNGKMRDADSVLRDTMSTLAGLEDQSMKAGLAQQLLSDVGLSLVQTGALDSEEALQKYLSAVSDSSTITDEAVEKARAWRSAMAEVKNLAERLQVQFFDTFGGDTVEHIDKITLAVEFLRTVGLEKINSTIARSVKGFQLLWDIIGGDLSLDQARSQAQAFEQALRESEAAAWDEVKAFAEGQKVRRELALATGEAGEATTTYTRKTKEQTEAEKEARQEKEQLRESLLRYTQAEQEAEDAFVKLTRILEDVAEAERIGALSAEEAAAVRRAAAKEFKEAAEKEVEAVQKAALEKVKAEREAADAVDAIRAVGREAMQDDLTEREQIEADHAEALAKLQKATTEALAKPYADADAIARASQEARLALEQDLAEQLSEMWQERLDEILGTASDLADGAADIAEMFTDAQSEGIEEIEDKLEKQADTLTASEKKALKEQLKAKKEAYRDAFKFQRGATLAAIILDGFAAVQKATASAPPPLNIPAILATGISVAARTAAAAAVKPSYHSGTPSAGAYGERTATVLPGESVVTEQGSAALGMQRVSQANRGEKPKPMEVVIIEDRSGGNTAEKITAAGAVFGPYGAFATAVFLAAKERKRTSGTRASGSYSR